MRKGFIESTKDEVRMMKERLANQSRGNLERLAGVPGSPSHHANAGPSKYSRLPSTADSPHREYILQLEKQQELLNQQDETMDLMSESMGNIRNMSEHISNELDEQAVMLDEFGSEIDHADSRVDATMKKMAKVLHLSDDRRQWMAIGALSSAMVLVLFLIFLM